MDLEVFFYFVFIDVQPRSSAYYMYIHVSQTESQA